MKTNTESLLSGVEPQPVPPDGSSDLSLTSRGFKINVPSNGQLYLATVKQVRNLLDKWPTRKAALFRPDMWGIDFLEAVSTITSKPDCTRIGDINREWVTNELAGKKFIPASGARAGIPHRIIGNTKNECDIIAWGDGPVLDKNWTYGFSGYPCATPVSYQVTNTKGVLSGSARNTNWACQSVLNFNCGFPNPITESFPADNSLCSLDWITFPYSFSGCYLTGGISMGWRNKSGSGSGVWACRGDIGGSGKMDCAVNPSYQVYDVLDFHVNFSVYFPPSSSGSFAIGPIVFRAPACLTENMVIGDTYMILDRVLGEYMLDDNSLPILTDPYWRDSSGPDDAITTTAIQWYWDGEGTVYLSYDPVKIGPIMFDDEIRIDVQNGTDLRIRDYALGAERIPHEGHIVSRDTPDITSLCRVGVNTITVSVRDTLGGKVGYCTPVYVKRKR